MIFICCSASSGRMKAVTKLFEENKTTTNCLQIMERVTFEPKDLYRLVQVLNDTFCSSDILGIESENSRY